MFIYRNLMDMTVYYIIFILYIVVLALNYNSLMTFRRRLTWNDRGSAIWSSNIGVGKFFLSRAR